MWRCDRLLAIVGADHTLSARASVSYAEALDYPMIGVLEASAITLLLEKQAQAPGRRPKFKFRVGGTDAARRLVAAGHGLTIMPDGVLQGNGAAQNLSGEPLSDMWSVRNLRLISRSGDVLPPSARPFRDALLATSVEPASVNADPPRTGRPPRCSSQRRGPAPWL